MALCTNASRTDKIMLFVIGPAIKDDDNLIKELYENIEILNYQNVIDLEEYINYSDEKIITEIMSDQEILNQATYQESEQAENDEEDNSGLNNAAQTEHDIALSKLYESVRKFWNPSFKQLSIEAFLEPTCNTNAKPKSLQDKEIDEFLKSENKKIIQYLTNSTETINNQ
ncbi:271_t:CDS:2, partial [Gigaspora margarita]